MGMYRIRWIGSIRWGWLVVHLKDLIKEIELLVAGLTV